MLACCTVLILTYGRSEKTKTLMLHKQIALCRYILSELENLYATEVFKMGTWRLAGAACAPIEALVSQASTRMQPLPLALQTRVPAASFTCHADCDMKCAFFFTAAPDTSQVEQGWRELLPDLGLYPLDMVRRCLCLVILHVYTCCCLG